jgi:hypothetical protein
LQTRDILCYYLLDDYLLSEYCFDHLLFAREDAVQRSTLFPEMEHPARQVEIEKNYPIFSRPMSHDDFLTALSGTEAAETTARGYTS